MNVLLLLIPLSIALVIGAAAAFFWAVNHDQFDDLESPKMLPLMDDPTFPDEPPSPGDRTAGAPRHGRSRG